MLMNICCLVLANDGEVWYGPVLSPLLFITILETLLQVLLWCSLGNNMCDDDLVIITNSLKEHVCKLKAWKEGMECKGLNKTKFMISSLGKDVLKDSRLVQSAAAVRCQLHSVHPV